MHRNVSILMKNQELFILAEFKRSPFNKMNSNYISTDNFFKVGVGLEIVNVHICKIRSK